MSFLSFGFCPGTIGVFPDFQMVAPLSSAIALEGKRRDEIPNTICCRDSLLDAWSCVLVAEVSVERSLVETSACELLKA